MIRAVTIAFPHDSKAPSKVLAGPEIPLTDQLSDLKKLGAERVHREFQRVEVWTSAAGLHASRKFLSAAGYDARQNAQAAETKAAAAEPKRQTTKAGR